MPSERELKRRLRSVRNIQQVTKAMQTVAASRMRRAQAATLASRPYEERLRTVLHELGPYAEPEDHPLLARRPRERALIVLVTSDRGLVGAMNTNLIRAALRFAQRQRAASYVAVGRKGISAMRRLRSPIVAEFTGLGDRPTSTDTNVVARVAGEEFVAARVDEVYLAFTRFVNTLRQEPTVRRILPLVPAEEEMAGGPRGTEPPGTLQYIFEPDAQGVLAAVLPRLVEVSIYQAVLESKASEQSARMVAMRNASDAAEEMIEDLTLTYNKARQDQITRELLDLVGGAEALSG